VSDGLGKKLGFRPGKGMTYEPLSTASRAYRQREGAKVTGLSLRFLYYAIRHKDLPTFRVGRCRLITEKVLREWLERKTEATVETHD
jgi:excisionase family DNA binding protein